MKFYFKFETCTSSKIKNKYKYKFNRKLTRQSSYIHTLFLKYLNFKEKIRYIWPQIIYSLIIEIILKIKFFSYQDLKYIFFLFLYRSSEDSYLANYSFFSVLLLQIIKENSYLNKKTATYSCFFSFNFDYKKVVVDSTYIYLKRFFDSIREFFKHLGMFLVTARAPNKTIFCYWYLRYFIFI